MALAPFLGSFWFLQPHRAAHCRLKRSIAASGNRLLFVGAPAGLTNCPVASPASHEAAARIQHRFERGGWFFEASYQDSPEQANRQCWRARVRGTPGSTLSGFAGCFQVPTFQSNSGEPCLLQTTSRHNRTLKPETETKRKIYAQMKPVIPATRIGKCRSSAGSPALPCPSHTCPCLTPVCPLWFPVHASVSFTITELHASNPINAGSLRQLSDRPPIILSCPAYPLTGS